MTNRDLLEKKLSFIERTLRELRVHARPPEIERDLREQRFVERELQLAIQAALDIASHVVSDERFEEPTTNAALFTTLVRHGVVPEALSDPLTQMAKFRNVLVHGYVDVDPAILRDVVENHLGDLDAFVSAIRARLDREQP
jgi:uncharacterized protein YutE (UPF0331/DUF86 family)